jgi:peroxiredoxin
MGKASRTKRERRVQAPPPVKTPKGAARAPADARRVALIATGALVAVVAIVVGVLLATRSSPSTGARGRASAADRNAPQSLVSAANAVGFQPTTEPGVGQVEGRPASAATPPTTNTLLPVGSKAPDFTLETPQGTKVSLASLRGKAALLEFFATWCPHCNAEAPHLRTLSQQLPKSKVAFLSVNADGETAPSVFAYHRYWGFPFPALVDPGSQPGSFTQRGAPGKVSQQYGIASYPTFYVIDPKGRIVWRTDGEQPDAKIRQELLKAASA